MCLETLHIACANFQFMSHNSLPTLLTRKQVAAWLQCSLRSVITYEQLGYLKRYDINGSVRYRLDEIDLNNFPQRRRK